MLRSANTTVKNLNGLSRIIIKVTPYKAYRMADRYILKYIYSILLLTGTDFDTEQKKKFRSIEKYPDN